MRAITFMGLVVALALVGCGVEQAGDPAGEATRSTVSRFGGSLPTTNVSFRGHYVVPAPPELAEAARFSVEPIEWAYSNGRAIFRYYLPVGLVGGSLQVTMSGPMSPGATTVTLTGPNGEATCTAGVSTITCSEDFEGLGSLPISEEVVRQVAAQEYPGSPDDRVAVAHLFGGDPIGTVEF